VEVLGVRVLLGVAEEGIVERKDACAFWNEVAAVPVVSFAFMSYTFEIVS
jgi:hypothetical protein